MVGIGMQKVSSPKVVMGSFTTIRERVESLGMGAVQVVRAGALTALGRK